jgi:hypothetical protein
MRKMHLLASTVLCFAILATSCAKHEDKGGKAESRNPGVAAVPPATKAEDPLSEPFVIKDLVPKACFENSTKTRVLVVKGEDGKLRSKAEWPTHRVEMVLMGMRVTLGESDDGSGPVGFFSNPPEKLEMPAPSHNFTGGMLSPEWFDGAEHIFTGNATVNQYDFQGERENPLTFKVVKGQGYVHICGKGTVALKGQQPRRLGDKESIPFWLKLSTSKDALIREGCAQALGYLALTASPDEKEQAKRTLTALLSDRSYEVRRNAIEGIVRVGASAEVAAVLKEMAAKDDNEWVKTCAKWAVGQGRKENN